MGGEDELYNNLMQQPEWIKDSTGKITGYKTPGGADTVFPFSYVTMEKLATFVRPGTYNVVSDIEIGLFAAVSNYGCGITLNGEGEIEESRQHIAVNGQTYRMTLSIIVLKNVKAGCQMTVTDGGYGGYTLIKIK